MKGILCLVLVIFCFIRRENSEGVGGGKSVKKFTLDLNLNKQNK